VEVERLQREYEVEVRFAPFFLDPTTPPEGKPRKAFTGPDDPPTVLEERGTSLGITFSRGRTMTSNSHLALEAAEFVAETAPHLSGPFHRAMFKSYFEDLSDIGRMETVITAAGSAGVNVQALSDALSARTYREQVDDGIRWGQAIGVTAVPTFVFNDRQGIVGAQGYPAFEAMMSRLGRSPRV